jgi:NitT/TauT family transport system substrate-binding protein
MTAGDCFGRWQRGVTAIVLTWLVGLAGVTANVAQAQTAIVVAQSSASLALAPLYIAQAQGYFTDENLKVDTVVSGGGPKAMASLLGGSAQFAMSAMSDTIAVHRRGQTDIRDIGVMIDNYTMPMLIRKDVAAKLKLNSSSPFKDRVTRLKGLRIGVTTPGSGSDFMVRYLALSNGLNPDRDMEIVPIGGLDSIRAAMEGGRVDICTCLPPVDALLIKNGTAVPYIDAAKDIDGLRGVHFATVHASDVWNKAHPQVVVGFLRALQRALNLMANDRAKAHDVLRAAFSQYDNETFDAAFGALYPNYPTKLALTAPGVQKEIDFENFFAAKGKEIKFGPAAIMDNSWAEQAEAGLKK